MLPKKAMKYLIKLKLITTRNLCDTAMKEFKEKTVNQLITSLLYF